eukprot:SAG31_NODE_26550_length_440_cov_1.011730_1_plen_103_part_00
MQAAVFSGDTPELEAFRSNMALTLTQMRSALADVVKTMNALGDKNVFYRGGLELFNEGDHAMLPDDLHPDGDGYEVMGRRFAQYEFGPHGRLLPGRVGTGKL